MNEVINHTFGSLAMTCKVSAVKKSLINLSAEPCSLGECCSLSALKRLVELLCYDNSEGSNGGAYQRWQLETAAHMLDMLSVIQEDGTQNTGSRRSTENAEVNMAKKSIE